KPPVPATPGTDSPGPAGDGIGLVEADLRAVDRTLVVPEEDDPGRVPAVPAANAASSVSTRQRREGIGVDRRRAGDVEDRDAVRGAAGGAVPGSAAGSRAVPAEPASDG